MLLAAQPFMFSGDVFGWVILGVSVILPIAVGGVVIRVMAEGLRRMHSPRAAGAYLQKTR